MSVGGLGPHEGFGVGVALLDPCCDVGFEFGDATVGRPAEFARGEFTKPAFDEVEPGDAGRRERHVETRVLQEPLCDGRRCVGGVAIADQVQVQLDRSICVDRCQELQEFLVPMPSLVGGNDSAAGYIQGGEQAGRTVADVVMGLPGRSRACI